MAAFPFQPFETFARAGRVGAFALGDVAEFQARLIRRYPFLANLTVRPAVAVTLLSIFALYLLPPLFVLRGDGLVVEIVESDARKHGTALSDARGRFVGAFPGELDSDPRYNRTGRVLIDQDIAGHAFPVHPDHKTLFVESPPPYYLACLRRLEDSNLGNRLANPHGVDVPGIVRAAASGFSAGGSGLSAQLLQQLVRPRLSNESSWARLSRKVGEILWGVPIMHAHHGEGRRFDQYLARHLPHVQRMQSEAGMLWGIEASAQVLFSRSAENLEPAQQLVLAGAIRRPVVFAIELDPQRRLRQSHSARVHWNIAINRARVCASDSTVLPDPLARAAALNALDSMVRDLPRPQADPVIERLGRERYGKRWPERARDPFRRANIFAFNAMRGIRAELIDAYGRSWTRSVASVGMTIDVEDERRLTPAFRQAMRSWLARRPDLNPVYRPWATYRPDAPEPREMPEIIMAVADGEGRLVRYYSSLESQPYFGDARNPAGVYDPQQETRQQASLAKVAGALVLLRAGTIDPTIVAEYARSNTEAMEARLSAADPGGRIGREITTILRWSDRSARDAGGRPLPLARSISTGMLAASPRTIHYGAAAITAALAGDPRPVQPPSLIGQIRFVDLNEGRLSLPAAQIPDAYGNGGQPVPTWRAGAALSLAGTGSLRPGALIAAADRASAILLLSAPICRGGTLALLRSWCAPERTRFIWGKTGTMDISRAYSQATGRQVDGVVLRAGIVGGVEFPDGRRFSFLLSVGGTGPAAPLTIGRNGARGLEAADLAPLINIVIADLARRAEGSR